MRRIRFRSAFTIPFFLLAPLFFTALRADDEIKATPVWTETFDNNDRGWIKDPSSPDWTGRIVGGVLLWENHHASEWRGTLMAVVVSQKRQPEYSLDVHFRPGDSKSSVGLQWGTTDNRREFLYFLVSADGHFRIGRSSQGALADFANGEIGKNFHSDAVQKLVVRVLGERSAFFVNGSVVWVGPTETSPGSMIGPTATPGGAAEFDNLAIGYLRAEPAVAAARLAAYTAALHDPAKIFFDAPATAPGSGTMAGFDIARSTKTVSPETLQGWMKEGLDLAQKYRYEEAEKLFRQILSHTPEDVPCRIQLAWCLLCRNQVQETKLHAELAQLFDPLGLSANLISAYAAAASGDWHGAEQSIDAGFFLDFENSALADVQKDMDELVRAGRGPAYAERLRGLLVDRHAKRSRDFTATGIELIQVSQAQGKGDYAAAEQHARAATVAANKLPSDRQTIIGYVNFIVGYCLYYSDNSRRSRPYLEEAHSRLQNAGTSSAYVRVRNAWLLADLAVETSEPARANEIANLALDEALRLPTAANGLKAEFFHVACRAANLAQKYPEMRTHATRLLTIHDTGRDPYYQALGHNFIGASFIKSTLPPDRKRARTEFEEALSLARDAGYGDLTTEITANLALSYWQAGERDRARSTYLDLAARSELQQNFAGAEVSLNNLAAMQYFGEDYAGAADTLRRAVTLTETARAKLGGEEKIHFLAGRLSAYQFLVLCLQRAGDASALFDAMNSFRARSLAETLNLGEPPAPITLPAFQQTLAPDEAAVFYALLGPGEIITQVVTRDNATSVHQVDYPAFVALKKKYLDRIHADRPGYKPTGAVKGSDSLTYIDKDVATQIQPEDFDDMVELTRGLIDGHEKAPPEIKTQLIAEFLGAFRQLLISPVEAKIAGRKKLILFPDGILNFMPFEALPESGGHFLVERFDVRYCQSAAVWQLLHSRHYPAENRLPFFGMGGAKFSAMEEKAPPADNQARLVELQLRAHQNVVANRPQREVYAALFGNEPMHYLRGSLIEVEKLSQIFPRATVFTGEDMTENRIKAMARDGSLRRYRIVHLATHGFAIPEVPELSGVAMSIFPTAVDGEDGYLTAPEIARLGLQTDLTVLSACQTALGRIYGGEGVAGLTGALLIGGSNRAIVSLWPVSDAGTMYFMQDLYTLTTREGKTYDEAVNIVKRHFIAGNYGEEFRDIQIWAPFVHYGL